MKTPAFRSVSSGIAIALALVLSGCSVSRSSSGWGAPEDDGMRASLYILTAEQISEYVSATSVEDLLEHHFSGFQRRTPDERPGADGQVYMLGRVSPLFVIDGVPVEYDGALGLNPHDVESIELVKHGASAMYGMRGSAGAVLITTKGR